jgi:RNA polymerase sigma-70 factor (ECF subfamily)
VGYQSAFDLQDALHETFRRAFEPSARAGYDGLRPYGPYLLAIARNVVLRGFRTREALFPAMDEAALAPHEIPISHLEVEVDPEVQVDREQMRALVQRFMDAQTPTDRDILTLRFVEGLSQRDVADHLGLGRQRVRTREARLRASLVRFLAAGERKAGLPTALAILCGGLLAWLLTTGGGS